MNKYLNWLRHNLFPTWYHAIITLIIVTILFYILPPLCKWLLFDADFFGSQPEACNDQGACWVFIHMRFNEFMYGFYPRDLEWRINLSYVIGALSFVSLIFAPKRFKRWCALFLFFIFPLIAFILYRGGIFGLEEVDTYSWSGLHLTLVLAFMSILLSFPIGIILALCRRSTIPVIHEVSTLFIELWRGVPLVSVLFMASYVIPMFFSPDLHFDKVLRALVGLTLFYSAYMAEEVGIGLHSLSRGQYEAANSLGFNYFLSTALIILPQVLRKTIPGIINVCIGLFKDTTLVMIIGLFDLLGIILAASENPKWLAFGLEGFIFATFAYWLFSYSISRFSIHLQHKLNVGRRS